VISESVIVIVSIIMISDSDIEEYYSDQLSW